MNQEHISRGTQERRNIRTRSRRSVWLLATFALMTYALTSAQAKVLPKTAGLLPPETVLLVDVENFSRLNTQFEKTSPYKLYKDPAMAAFIDNFKSKWREKVGKPDNEVVKTVVDDKVLPQGRLALALVLNKQALKAKEPTAFFIIQWGEKIDRIKEAVEKTIRKAVEDGLHQKTENYRAVSINTIIAEDSKRLGYGFSSTLHYSFLGDCLMGSEDIEVLKFAIAHLQGATSPTLSNTSDYTSAIKSIGPYHDIDIYVNIKQIIKTILSEDTTGRMRTTMANLGLDNVTSLGCSIGLAQSPGSSCCGKAFLKVEGAKKGICKMLALESAVVRSPRFIPASACSATFLNLNIRKVYDELANILNSFSPMYSAWMYTPLPTSSSPDEPGLQIKGDIINHLGPQIVVAQSISKPFSTHSSPSETFVAFAVSNAKALEKSLSLIHSKLIAPNNPDARRELLGHTIYIVALPALPFMTGGKTPMQAPSGAVGPQTAFAFTITDTHLIFGAEPTVERAIRTLSSTSDASMSSAKWFNTAKSAIPSVVGLASMGDNAASGELLWWMMKESGKVKTSITIGLGPRGLNELIHSSSNLLPEFDAVRKYFGLSAFYGVSRPDGFFFEFKYLNPGEAK